MNKVNNIHPNRCSEKRHQAQQYLIKDHNLEHVPLTRDLGIFIDNNLTFIPHTKTIIQKASTRARLLHFSFTSGDRTILAKAFCTYVRPILEYCSPVWNPHLKYLVQGIESAQRRFTKVIPSLRHQPYLTIKIQSLSRVAYVQQNFKTANVEESFLQRGMF